VDLRVSAVLLAYAVRQVRVDRRVCRAAAVPKVGVDLEDHAVRWVHAAQKVNVDLRDRVVRRVRVVRWVHAAQRANVDLRDRADRRVRAARSELSSGKMSFTLQTVMLDRVDLKVHADRPVRQVVRADQWDRVVLRDGVAHQDRVVLRVRKGTPVHAARKETSDRPVHAGRRVGVVLRVRKE